MNEEQYKALSEAIGNVKELADVAGYSFDNHCETVKAATESYDEYKKAEAEYNKVNECLEKFIKIKNTLKV